MLIRITAANRGPEAGHAAPAADALVPQHLVWGCNHEGCWIKPWHPPGGRRIAPRGARHAWASSISHAGPDPDGKPPLPGCSPRTRPTSSGSSALAQRNALRQGRLSRVRGPRPDGGGESAERRAPRPPRTTVLEIPPHGSVTIRSAALRGEESPPRAVRAGLRRTSLPSGIREADEFYAGAMAAAHSRRGRPPHWSPGLRRPALDQAVLPLRRQGLARRRPQQPPPPARRKQGRNADWPHLFNRDVLSMPDKWEYPWYAAWDLAFHMIPLARHRSRSSPRSNSCCFLREWYMHPNGQIPAYEFALGDVNPPVHAWACWRVYKMTGAARRARPAVPGARLPQAADQLHLVGEPQGHRGQEPLLRRLPGPGQHRRVRPLQAAARRRPLRAGRRHGLDGVLLRHHAVHGPGTGQRGPGLRGHGLQVLRALRRHRRRHEHPGRHRPVGRGGRLLLRPAPGRWQVASRCASARWSG